MKKLFQANTIVSVAYAEAGIGYNFLDCVTSVSKDGELFTLNGSKSLVLNAGNANQFIVLATHENAPALVIINAEDKGISVQSFKTLDGQTCGELTFENVSLEAESILALGDEAEVIIQ